MNKKKIILRIILGIILLVIAGILVFVFVNTNNKNNEKPNNNQQQTENNNTDNNKDKDNNQSVKPVVSTKDYNRAKEAVEKAYESYLQADFDAASKLVNKLKSGDKKTQLLNQLIEIKKGIDCVNLVTNLESLLVNATKKEDIVSVKSLVQEQNIESMLEELTNETKKEELSVRLANVMNILNDETNPIVQGVEDNTTVNTDIALEVEEENEYTTYLNGEEFDSTKEITEEGSYELVVIDQAFNQIKINFTIDKTAPIITGVEKDEYTYHPDGVTPNSVDEDIKKIILTKDEVEVSNYELGTALTSPANYKLIVTDLAGNEKVVEFKIVKGAATILLAEPKSLVYSGEAKEYVAIVAGVNNENLGVAEVKYYTVGEHLELPSISDVGTYKVEVTFDGDENYESAALTKEVNITKATLTMDFDNNTLEYNGYVQNYEPVLKNQDGAQVYIGFDSVVYKDSNDIVVTEPTNAGTYTVSASVLETDNYTAVNAEDTFEITKVDATINLMGPNSFVYDGTNKVYTAEVVGTLGEDLGVALVEYYDATDTLTLDTTNVGSYYVKAIFAGNDNYKTTEVIEYFEVTKADLTITLQEPNSFVYDGNVKEYTVEIVNQDGTVVNVPTILTYEDSTLTEVPSVIIPGIYSVTAEITETENYTSASVSADFEVTGYAAKLEVVPTDRVFFANGNPISFTAIAKDIDNSDLTSGTISYEYYEGETLLTGAPSVVGSYKVKIIYTPDLNVTPYYIESITEVSYEVIDGYAFDSDNKITGVAISTKEQLKQWAKDVQNKKYSYAFGAVVNILNDIDLDGEVWTPFNTGKVLNGVIINGNNKAIKNMTVENVNNGGFIGENSSALIIKDLIFEGASVTTTANKSQTYAGVVMAKNYAVITIDNVTVQNSEVINNWQAGGLVGYADHDITFTNCTVKNTFVGGNNSTAGTLFGLGIVDITVTDCTAENVSLYTDGMTYNSTQKLEGHFWVGHLYPEVNSNKPNVTNSTETNVNIVSELPQV